MGKKLAETEAARYERDAFLFPVDAFSPAEARHYRGCRCTTPISSIAPVRTDSKTGASGSGSAISRPRRIVPGNFDDEIRPQADYGAAERAFHAEAVAPAQRGEPLSDAALRGRVMMRTRFWLALIGLLLSLAAAGCVESTATSDDDKRGVFYGGITGGGSWP